MRFLQYVCQKSLLRQYCNAKVQKLFQLPPFAVLNLPKLDEETVCHDGFYLHIVTKKALCVSANFSCLIFLSNSHHFDAWG